MDENPRTHGNARTDIFVSLGGKSASVRILAGRGEGGGSGRGGGEGEVCRKRSVPVRVTHAPQSGVTGSESVARMKMKSEVTELDRRLGGRISGKRGREGK